MFRRILIAVDRSEPAMLALKTGADLANQAGASVRLVHVVHPPIPFSPASIPQSMETEGILLDAGWKMLAESHSEFPPGSAVEDKVVEGHTADEIVDQAKSWQADLIVMGNHSRNALSRFLLGSTAEAVVRHAPCPILVVREKDQTSPTGERQHVGHSKLFPVGA